MFLYDIHSHTCHYLFPECRINKKKVVVVFGAWENLNKLYFLGKGLKGKNKKKREINGELKQFTSKLF